MRPSAQTAAAYSRRSAEYIVRFDNVSSVNRGDRDRITQWATGIAGPLLDAGCGPGQWTGHLAGLGCDIEGVDLTPEFIEHARARYPGPHFQVADFANLPFDRGSLAGVLAWFSLIHLSLDELRRVLHEFGRSLTDEGELLVGYFSGSDTAVFDHKVAAAYTWSTRRMAAELESAGFIVTDTWHTNPPDGRATAGMIARRVRHKPTH